MTEVVRFSAYEKTPVKNMLIKHLSNTSNPVKTQA